MISAARPQWLVSCVPRRACPGSIHPPTRAGRVSLPLRKGPHMKTRVRVVGCLSLLLALGATGSAEAQSLGVSATGISFPLGNPPFSLGYTFDVVTPFTVQYLGYFD